MRTATVEIESVAPLGWGRRVRVEKLEGEDHEAYEARTWREKMHSDKNGVFIPPMALKLSLETAAKNYAGKIPNEGNAKWTKHFSAGVLCPEPAYLGIGKEDLEHEWLFVPSGGEKGSGKRVDKCFPLIRAWVTTAVFYVLDDKITEKVFESTLEKSGQFVGIGFFRPDKGGYYGRFKINKVTWS